MNDILYLEVDEEIPSVIEKLKRQQTADVVLVVPAGASLVQSIVNVKLLKRTAEKLKQRLALVTADPIGRHVASQVGLPVYVSVKDRRSLEPVRTKKPAGSESDELDLRPVVADAPANVAVHHYTEPALAPVKDSPGFTAHALAAPAPPAPPAPTVPLPTAASSGHRTGRKRFLVGLVGVALAGLLAALWYFYPAVLVDLTVATEPYQATLPLTVDSSKQFVAESDSSVLPGEHIAVTTEAVKEQPATGHKDVGTKATGTAALENRLGQAVKLAKGTTLTNGGQSFLTTAEITIPSATASIDASGSVVVKPGTADVAIEASNVGEAGNVAKGTTLSVQGAGATVQEKVSASTKAALSGGTSKQVTVVSDDDRSNARQAAVDEAERQAREQAAGSVAEKRVLSEAVRTTVVNEDVTPATGEEAGSVSAKVTVKYEAIVFDDQSFRASLGHQLEASVPAEKMAVLNANDEVSTAVSSVDWSAGTIALVSTINTRLAPRVSEADIRSLLSGQSVVDAQSALQRQSAIERATLTVRPSWLPRLPQRPEAYRIRFSQAVAE